MMIQKEWRGPGCGLAAAAASVVSVFILVLAAELWAIWVFARDVRATQQQVNEIHQRVVGHPVN